MLFWIPDPAFWGDPGPVPHSRFTRWLHSKAGGQFFTTKEPWVQVYRRYHERLQREQEEMEHYLKQQADYEAMLAEYDEQGHHMADMLPTYLHRVRLSHWRKVIEKKTERSYDHIDYCEVEDWYFDESAYYFWINSWPLPYGVTVKQFMEPEVADTLSAAFGSKASVEFNPRDHQRPGLWVIVEHKAGRGMIPRLVRYSDMIKALPKTAPPLTFPVGVGSNGKAHFADMDEVITVLVVGSRGAGKSNTINAILCTWLKRVPPSQLRLFLTDLKGGLEFHDYEGIPHLGGDVDLRMRLTKDSDLEPVRLGQEIAVDPPQVIPILQYMNKEMERRQNLMKGKARKISAYNRKYKNKLSYWVLVVDELATLMDSSWAKDAKQLLGELTRKGRAVGLYIILATQVPDKTVLTRQIAGNMDCRIVGRLADGASSGLSLGDGTYDATYLPFDVPGRVVFRWADKRIVQAPLIPEMTIKQAIRAAKAGQTGVDDTEETAIAEELFTYALDYLGGLCANRELFRHFRNRIPKHKIQSTLKKWELKNKNGLGPVISLGDDEYYLIPSVQNGDGRYPRQLVNVIDFNRDQDKWLEPLNQALSQVPRPRKNEEPVP
jgi:hypothetical protein